MAIMARMMQTSQMAKQKSPKNLTAKAMSKDEWRQTPYLPSTPNASGAPNTSNTSNTSTDADVTETGSIGSKLNPENTDRYSVTPNTGNTWNTGNIPKKKKKKKTQNKAQKPIPNIGLNEEIYCRDLKLKLSDDKLRNVLLHIYEKGRSDAQKSHIYDHWLACFSFAFTSSIPLWTADFHDFWEIPANISKGVVMCLSLGSFVIGVLFSVLSLISNGKNKTDANQERDKAVEEAIQKLKLQAKGATNSTGSEEFKDYDGGM